MISKLKKFVRLVKKLRSLIDIWHYIVGTYRYKLYCYRYSTTFTTTPFCKITPKDKLKRLVAYLLFRDHIIEQIEYRIEWMEKECYMNGECKLCGCSTVALQCASKPCDKPCYPTMMSASQWKAYKKGSSYKDKNGIWLALISQNLKPIYFKETYYGLQQQTDIIPEEVPTYFSQKDSEIKWDIGSNTHY